MSASSEIISKSYIHLYRSSTNKFLPRDIQLEIYSDSLIMRELSSGVGQSGKEFLNLAFEDILSVHLNEASNITIQTSEEKEICFDANPIFDINPSSSRDQKKRNTELLGAVTGALRSPPLKEFARRSYHATFQAVSRDVEKKSYANEAYWRNLANLIVDKKRDDSVNRNDFERLSGARDLFQQGVTLVMDRQTDSGLTFLNRSLETYGMLTTASSEPGDFVRLFIIGNLLNNNENRELIRSAIRIIEKKLYFDVIRYAYRDIFEIFHKRNYLEFNRDFINESESFPSKAPDKYTYEILADQLVALGRLQYLANMHHEVKRSSAMAQELYNLANKHLEKTVSKKTPQENVSADIERRKKAREMLRGNIPIFELQAVILENLCKLRDNKKVFPELIESFEQFFSQVIHPRDKVAPFLGFVEELEWALIKKKLYKYSLGFFWTEPQDKILRICMR